MVIYVDVLIIVNTIIDYFLLKLSGITAGQSVRLWRILIGSLCGGISSLYIFAENIPTAIDITLRIIFSFVLILITYGYGNIKSYIKTSVFLLMFTFILGGILFAFCQFLKPSNMIINNSVTYIDINPVILIVSASLFYIAAISFRYFTARNGELAKECTLTVTVCRNRYTLTAMVDTGNSLTDAFGLSEIIIADSEITKSIRQDINEEEYQKRFRAVPVNTVAGKSILNGIRADRVIISAEKLNKSLINPIIVASNTALTDGWNAIVNPRSIL